MKRINSKEIARLAGVSRSTVSRVINSYPDISKETYDKVMKVNVNKLDINKYIKAMLLLPIYHVPQ